MIAYLIGTIQSVFDHSFILDVQGLGYEVFASGALLQSLVVGESREIYTHHHIREDNQTLYGFATIEERQLFKKLISVSGVGPKSGLSAISAAPLRELIRAIQLEDHSVFQSVSGIGPKIAKRLVLELRNKVEWDESIVQKEGDQTFSARADLFAALEQLGYTTNEVRPVVNDIDLTTISIEEAIRHVLKQIQVK